MTRSTGPNILMRVAAVVAVTVVAVGCGVSTDKVVDAIPVTTVEVDASTSVPTTAESTTTEPAPEETTTTRAPATTVSEPPPTAGGGSVVLPPEAKDAFMKECAAGAADTDMCACVWDQIQGDLDVETLLAAGSTGEIPPELQTRILEATMECSDVSAG